MSFEKSIDRKRKSSRNTNTNTNTNKKDQDQYNIDSRDLYKKEKKKKKKQEKTKKMEKDMTNYSFQSSSLSSLDSNNPCSYSCSCSSMKSNYYIIRNNKRYTFEYSKIIYNKKNKKLIFLLYPKEKLGSYLFINNFKTNEYTLSILIKPGSILTAPIAQNILFIKQVSTKTPGATISIFHLTNDKWIILSSNGIWDFFQSPSSGSLS